MEKVIEEFFDKLHKDGVEESVNHLFQSNPWMLKKEDDTSGLISELNSTLKIVGKYHDYQLITSVKSLNHMYAASYMVRYERQPIHFEFQFYKAQNEWKFHGIHFESNFDDILKSLLHQKIIDIHSED